MKDLEGTITGRQPFYVPSCEVITFSFKQIWASLSSEGATTLSALSQKFCPKTSQNNPCLSNSALPPPTKQKHPKYLRVSCCSHVLVLHQPSHVTLIASMALWFISMNQELINFPGSPFSTRPIVGQEQAPGVEYAQVEYFREQCVGSFNIFFLPMRATRLMRVGCLKTSQTGS